jgi:hypothetical protein
MAANGADGSGKADLDVEAAFGACGGGEYGAVGADDSQTKPVSAGVLGAVAAQSLERREEAVHLVWRDRLPRSSIHQRHVPSTR